MVPTSVSHGCTARSEGISKGLGAETQLAKNPPLIPVTAMPNKIRVMFFNRGLLSYT
jgi:hypothetical protein